MAVTAINSKHPITHFTVLKHFKNANQTLIECNLDTGRTHQIRVHLNYIGYPIYNDPVYGKRKETTSFGQFLHSKKISFNHPITGKLIEIETDLPKEFKDYLEEIDIHE
jgi:23S rRNA pseudouridine1911/1915/1917 synthase